MNSSDEVKNSSLLLTSALKRTASDDTHNELISMEKLDRQSPDLWPEKIPGVNDFIAMTTPNIPTSPPAWARGLSQDDINSMHQLACLSPNGLITEIRKLYDEAYQLGIQESKEMTRGKYLNIFQAPAQTNKRK